MKILDRHLLRSLLVPLFYCLCGFSLLFIVFELFGDLSKLLETKAPKSLVVWYYLLKPLPALDYVTPASMMLATLYAMWTLSKGNEIVAMRANGISLPRISLPFLATGLAATACNATVKELITPAALEWSDSFKGQLTKSRRQTVHLSTAYFNTRDRRQWVIDRFDTDRPSLLHGVKIVEERPDGTRLRELTARKAQYMDGRWWLFGPMVQVFDASDAPVGLPVAALPGRDPVMEMDRFSERPSDFVHEVRPWDFLTSREMARYLRRHPGLSPRELAEKRVKLHGRQAMPWACLVVTLFAVPAGARTGRQSALVGVFLAVACFFLFYAAEHVGMYVGIRQWVTPWVAAWLPNLGFLVGGAYMLFRAR